MCERGIVNSSLSIPLFVCWAAVNFQHKSSTQPKAMTKRPNAPCYKMGITLYSLLSYCVVHMALYHNYDWGGSALPCAMFFLFRKRLRFDNHHAFTYPKSMEMHQIQSM